MSPRTRLPEDREGITQRFVVHVEDADDVHLYLTASVDAQGRPREIFVRTTDRSGWVSSLEAIVTSKELVTLLPKLDRARTSAFRGRASVAKAAADNFKRNGAGSLTFAEPRYAGRTPDGQCVDVTIGAQRWLIPEQ